MFCGISSTNTPTYFTSDCLPSSISVFTRSGMIPARDEICDTYLGLFGQKMKPIISIPSFDTSAIF